MADGSDASGEMPVGTANKLAIESAGKFQSDVSRGRADAVRVEEAQRQQAAEAMLQAGTQLLASQQRRVTGDDYELLVDGK